jgi:hypothetical protein
MKPTIKAVLRDRLPLTPAAKGALRTSRRAMTRNDRVGAQHAVLTALLDLQPPDHAATLFSALGVDRGAVRARIAPQADAAWSRPSSPRRGALGDTGRGRSHVVSTQPQA